MPDTWVPAVFGLLGALIGGAISYLTVRQQLERASEEARLEREHVLKRAVFLEAVEGMAKSVHWLANIARSDLSMQQLSEMPGGNAGWAHRVHAVANLDTIKALDKANDGILSHALDLMVKRMGWENLRDEAAALHERLTQRAAHGEQLVAALQALPSPGTASEAGILALRVTEDIRTVHAETEELAAVWREASDRQLCAHRDLVAASWKSLAEHTTLLADAIVHLRRELGLPFDERDYVNHSEQTSRRSLARLERLLRQMEQLAGD